MSGTESPVTRPRWNPAGPLGRALSIADQPGDDDDTRLRKRVGVIAGAATIVAPLTLPVQAPVNPWSVPFAIGLAAYALVNLLVLARTRAFDRYVVALIAGGVVFVPAATFLGGGITGSSPGLVWGFLVPAYAIMALGPRRAGRRPAFKLLRPVPPGLRNGFRRSGNASSCPGSRRLMIPLVRIRPDLCGVPPLD